MSRSLKSMVLLAAAGATACSLANAQAVVEAPKPVQVPLSIFTVPKDLEVTVWAQSPDLKNPTNMDVDAAGRIWVTEGVNYRRHATRDPKGDRVVVLEDTDKDGRADKSSVFVQEPTLVAPLGIAVIDNRIIVSNAPDLIVYTDVNRNLKFDPGVDKREVLLSGFDGRNHDHALHSVTFGPDGRWYFSQGNAGAHFTDRGGQTFRVGSNYNPVPDGGAQPVFGNTPPMYAGAKSDDGHVYVGGFSARMQPDGTGVEILGFNFRNSYEQSITSFGDIFHNDNDDYQGCRTTWLMEYGSLGFFSRDGKRSWQADRRPGQSIPTAEWRQEDPGVIPSGDVYGGGAPTGIVTNEGDGLGKKYRGLLLSADAARNTIFGYYPRQVGAGYELKRFDFLTSNSEQAFAGTDFKGGKANSEIQTFFRPSDVAVGPDGAVYVADWFDPRVGGHADQDDTTSGAIYRIAPKGFKSVVPSVDVTTIEGQITALRSPAVNVRALGFNALATRGGDAIPAVSALLSDENPYIRARAVWLLGRLGPEGQASAAKLLSHEDPALRATAYRVTRQAGTFLTYAGSLTQDPSPAVRREVALSLRDVPFEKSGHLLLELAKSYDGRDRWYLEAWGTGATGKEAALYEALAKGQAQRDATKWPATYSDLVWRLTPAAGVNALAQRAQSDVLPVTERIKAITALGFIEAGDAVTALLDTAQKAGGDFRSNPALWWLVNYKDSRWASAGVDAELKKRGLFDPDNVQISEVTIPEAPASTLSVANVLKLKGDAKRGAAAAAACQMCHRIAGNGAEYGPDLTGFASRQTREVVITAIVNPSSDIAHGYDGAEITLTDGRKIHGMVLSGGNPLIVQSTGGVIQMIPATMVKERKRLGRSLMLSADQMALSAQQVADITAYLK